MRKMTLRFLRCAVARWARHFHAIGHYCSKLVTAKQTRIGYGAHACFGEIDVDFCHFRRPRRKETLVRFIICWLETSLINVLILKLLFLRQIPTTQAQRELIEGTSDGKECEENRVVLTLPEGKRTLMITLNFLQSKKGISECVEPRDFCLIINCIEYLGMEFNWQEKPSAAMFDYLDKVMRTISDMDINALWTRKTTGLLDKWVQSLFDRGLSLKHYCGGKSHWLQYEIANRHKELVFADLDAKIKLVVSKRGEPKNLLLGKHLDPNLPLSPAAQQFIQERMSEASQHYPVELVAATNEEGKSNLYVFLDWWVSAL